MGGMGNLRWDHHFCDSAHLMLLDTDLQPKDGWENNVLSLHPRKEEEYKFRI